MMMQPDFRVILRAVGPKRVLQVLYRYGAPPSMAALEAVLLQEMNERSWRQYMADAALLTAAAVSGQKKLNRYQEFGMDAPVKTVSRSGIQIMNDILHTLGMGGIADGDKPI